MSQESLNVPAGTVVSSAVIPYETTQDVYGIVSAAIVSGSQIIRQGGISYETEVKYDALQEVYGRSVRDKIEGSQVVYSGGVASGTMVQNGTQEVYGYSENASGYDQTVHFGGVASGANFEAQDVYGKVVNYNVNEQSIFSGGIASDGNVFRQTIAAGGSAYGTVVNSEQQVMGTAINTVLSTGGQFISSGGIATNTTVGASSYQGVWGGTASGTIIQLSGEQEVMGSAIATTISGGSQTVHSGGVDKNSILQGGLQTISSGGKTIGAILKSGYQNLYGIASNASVSKGAEQYVGYNGLAIRATIYAGGVQNMTGKASSTLIYGSQHVWGSTFKDIIYKGGRQFVSGGTVTSAQIKSGGSQIVYDNATATGTVISKGGLQFISGGVAKNTVYKSGAIQHVRGGSAHAGILSAGVKQMVSNGGIANKTTLRKGSVQGVYSGGSALGVVVSSGGSQVVLGGYASATRLLKGGRQTLSKGGIAMSTTVSSGATLLVASGGLTSAAIMKKGGTLQINKGGSAHLSGNGAGTVDMRAGATLHLGGIQHGYIVPIVKGYSLKVQGKVDMYAGALRNTTVAGTKSAQVKGRLYLENNNNFKAVTVNMQNSMLNLRGTGNKVDKLVTNANAITLFSLEKVSATDTKYMLTAAKKNTLTGRVYINLKSDQKFGTYELASNLNISKTLKFNVDINGRTTVANSSSNYLTLTTGKAKSVAGVNYALKYAANKLTLTVKGVTGQLKKSVKSAKLQGTANNDIFYGGKGNDVITGNGGRDVAVYDTKAWGKDRIDAAEGSMTILFSGIKSKDVTRKIVNGDMVITRKGKTGQSITVENWDASSHKIVFGGTLGQFSKYAAAAKPTAAQKTQAFNEVWKKAGMLA